MYFKRLEMHGFKSFAEPVIIDFHEGVTCIVGPNGSGKSNISDAIRWVLGEQSPKALRGGKMEEVIFAGTASRKSRGMAEVTLVIDNTSGILDIDYNEVAITRRMFRSGESEYLINNNQCRLRDIRELIMDTGIGVDGYSIIGQGKIADIVSNKPESRREIFEEAAGVVMYKSKKADAERKLDSTNNNLERVNDIVGEIEDRIEGLCEDSAKAKEYLTLKEKYRDLEINITLKNIENINTKSDEFKKDIISLNENINKITESKKSVDDEVTAAREKSETLDNLGNQSREKQLQLIDEINALNNETQLNEERLNSIEKEDFRLKGEIEELENKISREEDNCLALEKSENEIKVKLKEATANLEGKIKEHNIYTQDSSNTAEQIDFNKNELFRLHNEISSKRSEAKSIDSLKLTLNKRKEQLINESKDASKNNVDNDASLEEAINLHNNEASRLSEIRNYLSVVIKDESQFLGKKKLLAIDIEDLKIKGSQKASRKKTIEEMESNYEGYNYAVKYIMRSRINGIQGVVAELMSVPTGFEVAIETALGSGMQNIICDDDISAKKAVNQLKENKAGRLTFLPISSIKGRTQRLDSSIITDKGYKGMGSECVDFDEKYRGIFEYLLGRVVIVENMDTAIRLSKLTAPGIRIVTLDGEVINASGAITGGKYKNKSANLLERKSEIDKLSTEIEIIQGQIKEKTEEVNELTERLTSLTTEKINLEAESKQKEIAIASLESRISSLKASKLDMESDCHKFEKELRSIENEMNDADTMIAKLENEANLCQGKIDEINEMLETFLETYEKEKETVSQANEEITKMRIEVNGWENKEQNAHTLIARVNGTIDDYRMQLNRRKQDISQLENEKNQILFGTSSDIDISDKLKEKEELEEYIEKISLEKAAISERVNKISKEQQSANESLNAYQDQKYQLEIKQAKHETQLDSLKDRLWDDFEISYVQALEFKKEDFVMSSSVKESREIRNRIRELGEVNVGAIKEYESVSERYKFLTEQKADIVKAMDELKAIIEDMDNTIKTKFKENFDQIVVNFEDIFKDLFGGGHAELRMEDEDNPLDSGIDIIAQPPGKKLQNINLMSGGEKTMTAIALMFAVLKTKPTPFCILDEVEAALDDANIDRFANYLRKFNGIQFALVTHQKATMEHADVLYGVTMPEQGISKVLSLRLGDNFDL